MCVTRIGALPLPLVLKIFLIGDHAQGHSCNKNIFNGHHSNELMTGMNNPDRLMKR